MNPFPSGIAAGDAFCNRVTEREQLKKYIKNVQHVVLIAPRRYGKSSLVNQVMLDDCCCHVWLDFLSVTSQAEADQKIRLACKQLLLLLVPELKKLGMQALDKVKSLSPELSLSALGQSLTLKLSSDDNMAIDELLMALDQYATKISRKAVLVMDEFQQISEIKGNQRVEALIRHAVERSQSITYIFSGSKRHMLQEMFSQSHRPLYRLCRVMPLERIEAEAYIKFISHAAVQRWKQSLSDAMIEKILLLTERHSFYLNALCNELWLDDNPPQDCETVESVWRAFVIQHKSVILSDIISLPLNQKKVIRELSSESESEPYSSKFSIKVALATASIRRAFEALLLKDIVFQDESLRYKVLDPAVAYYFKYLH